MTQKAKLEALLSKCEAGDVIQSIDASDVFPTKGDDPIYLPWIDVCNASQGSLDAALSLHKAMLHESVQLTETYSVRYGATAKMNFRGKTVGVGYSDDNPALAWLIAIIKTLISEYDK